MSTEMSRKTQHTQQPSPRRGRMDRRSAIRLAADEYARVADAVAALDADDWTKPTDCPSWDVRQLACHIVGMAEMAAGIREGNRQRKLAGADAARRGIQFIDALTDVQVRERADWTPTQVVNGARDVGPRAARGRRWTPFFIRRRALPVPQHVNGRDEEWTIGYLVDTILTRDPWMHRVDLARATGKPLELTAAHDGAIVADAVAEWAERHAQPYSLTLTGPAGGAWARGEDGPSIAMDAVEFCRVISGRGPAEGLLATQVPF
jgi:uncharacterized protein (TIGR03083 family)